MKVGIFLKGEKLPERFVEITQKFIQANNELIKELRISKDLSNCLIITDCNTYQGVRTSINAARGYRFHKAYYDINTTLEELCDIIIPLTNPLNEDGDRAEMIHERQVEI